VYRSGAVESPQPIAVEPKALCRIATRPTAESALSAHSRVPFSAATTRGNSQQVNKRQQQEADDATTTRREPSRRVNKLSSTRVETAPHTGMAQSQQDLQQPRQLKEGVVVLSTDYHSRDKGESQMKQTPTAQTSAIIEVRREAQAVPPRRSHRNALLQE
jgi:hypothetical protein